MTKSQRRDLVTREGLGDKISKAGYGDTVRTWWQNLKGGIWWHGKDLVTKSQRRDMVTREGLGDKISKVGYGDTVRTWWQNLKGGIWWHGTDLVTKSQRRDMVTRDGLGDKTSKAGYGDTGRTWWQNLKGGIWWHGKDLVTKSQRRDLVTREGLVTKSQRRDLVIKNTTAVSGHGHPLSNTATKHSATRPAINRVVLKNPPRDGSTARTILSTTSPFLTPIFAVTLLYSYGAWIMPRGRIAFLVHTPMAEYRNTEISLLNHREELKSLLDFRHPGTSLPTGQLRATGVRFTVCM